MTFSRGNTSVFTINNHGINTTTESSCHPNSSERISEARNTGHRHFARLDGFAFLAHYSKLDPATQRCYLVRARIHCKSKLLFVWPKGSKTIQSGPMTVGRISHYGVVRLLEVTKVDDSGDIMTPIPDGSIHIENFNGSFGWLIGRIAQLNSEGTESLGGKQRK